MLFPSVQGSSAGCCAGRRRSPSCIGACKQRNYATWVLMLQSRPSHFAGRTYTTADVYPPPLHVVAKLYGGSSCSARSRLLSHRLFTNTYAKFAEFLFHAVG